MYSEDVVIVPPCRKILPPPVELSSIVVTPLTLMTPPLVTLSCPSERPAPTLRLVALHDVPAP